VKVPAWVKGTLLLAIAFGAGVTAGVGYERRQVSRHEAVVAQNHDVIHHLARELDLDSAQQQAIAEIFARRQWEVDVTWHAIEPHVRATVDSTQQEIARILRPDQLARFQKMATAVHSAGHR
jgi:phosphoenolpyruvate carboxylase